MNFILHILQLFAILFGQYVRLVFFIKMSINFIIYQYCFMLHFSNLDKLSSHHDYLTTIFGDKKFFFVGGMIRDLLLNRETNMDDVDITA